MAFRYIIYPLASHSGKFGNKGGEDRESIVVSKATLDQSTCTSAETVYYWP